MKKYFKISFIAKLTILLLIVSTPYWSGMLIEKYYRQFTSQLSNESKFKVELKEFKRCFFTSTAQLELHVMANDNTNEKYIIPIQQKIIHGPIVIDFNYKKLPISIALAHIHNKLGPEFKTQLVEFFNTAEPISIMTRLSFLGKGTTFFSGAKLKQTTKTNFDIVWEGITGKVFHSLDLSNIKGEITAPKLSIKNSEFHLEITNMVTKFKSTKENSLAIGNSTLHIGDLIYQEQEQTLLKLANVDINSKLENEKTDPQKLSYSLTAKTSSSQILKQAFIENTYSLTAKSITPEFFTILHANYDKKFALLDDLLRQLLNSQSNITLTIPKYFTQALISFCNLQLYKNSIIGKIDPRPKTQLLTEISNTMAVKFDKLVALKILMDNNEINQYKMTISFDKAGKILLNGEPLQNPLQALKEFEQASANAEIGPAVDDKNATQGVDANAPAPTATTTTSNNAAVINSSSNTNANNQNNNANGTTATAPATNSKPAAPNKLPAKVENKK